jgi:beta-carotene ketolase (CrtO type)
LANYKTPIEGLYLTGAGTHPGGSISGMPGRNTARVFMHSQQPGAPTLADAANSLKSTAKSVFRVN